jgi:hypothetical protein
MHAIEFASTHKHADKHSNSHSSKQGSNPGQTEMVANKMLNIQRSTVYAAHFSPSAADSTESGTNSWAQRLLLGKGRNLLLLLLLCAAGA